MPIQVLICDDSGLARKQLARALPEEFDAQISFASDGQEALESIRETDFDLLFLDLTMPVLDGYEVLERLNSEDRMLDVVVVSGDIQTQAQERVNALGALEFIKKPCSRDTLVELLPTIGYPLDISDEGELATNKPRSVAQPDPSTAGELSPKERISEVANVAMGRAASLLAEFLDVFVVLPIPMVNELEVSELQMAVAAMANSEHSSAVCQGFIGFGISGEAFFMLHDTNINELAKLMNYDSESEEDQREVLMDVANILISASLKGFEEQLDIRFSQGHPTMLNEHEDLQQMLNRGSTQWKKTLAIEFDYSVEMKDIHCTLLLLFSEDGLPMLHKRTAYLG